MKVMTLVFLIVAAVAGADFSPRFAYLLVPPSPGTWNSTVNTTASPAADQPQTSSTTSTPQPRFSASPASSASDSQLAELKARLEKDETAEKGVYHVLTSEGKLQRIEYLAVPVSSVQAQSEVSEKQTDGPAQPADQSAVALEGAAVYFVQLPAGQLRQEQQQSPQDQQTPEADGADATENAAAQVKAQFLPLRQLPPTAFLPQYAVPAQVQSQFETSQRFRQQQSEAEGQGESQQTENSAKTADNPESYLARVQYTEIQPLSGPIFAYSPADQLVRILRHV